jgi:two-component system sensor histidine kinase QseC
MRALGLASMQARLLALLLALVTIVWLGAAAVTWVDARHELDELLDGHLAQAAALLVVQQSQTDLDDEVADAPSLHKYAPKVAFQVFHEGRLVMRSGNAGQAPMSGQSRGFSTVQMGAGDDWRVFGTRGEESDVQVYVAEQTGSRNAILHTVLSGLLLPLAVALPLLALAGWWSVRRGLAPLRDLSQALGQRRVQALEPVVLEDMPTEIKPLVDALNALFERVDSVLATERRFTADAAHELRTPIAAIRAQAQVALGAGGDTAQRDHALHTTLAGCDRATRLVDQLLTLARLEARPNATLSATLPSSDGCADLSAVTQRMAAELALTALAQGQTLELDAPVPCLVSGDDLLLSVLVRNLIDNALRYSPPGASVQVSVHREGGQVALGVEDSGPGMSDAELGCLGERFYRVLGHQQTGSGLGWSIILRIAQVYGARVQARRSARLGGLSVTVYCATPTI